MTTRPLLQQMMKFQENYPISFHVPGHKGGIVSNLTPNWKQALVFDLTELNGLDNLHNAEGVIKEAQQLLSNTYNSKKSYFLVNGTTVGNLAMIHAMCKRNDFVLVQRNAHQSIFRALEMIEAVPILLSPEWDTTTQTAGHISLETLKQALDNYSNISALVLTTPTYYGLVAPHLEQLIKMAHEKNIPVLVDEAHGAHFVLDDPFPYSALELGADVVVQSAHKTLPAMTMGSYLHIGSDRVSQDRLEWYLRALQSSSPSYMIMASLDDARAYIEFFDDHDREYFQMTRKSFIESLRAIPSLEIVEVDDLLKLIIRVKNYSGQTLQQFLEKEKVYVELADSVQVVLVLPLLTKHMNFPFVEAAKRIKFSVQKMLRTSSETIELVPMNVKNKISTLEISYDMLKNIKIEYRHYKQSVESIAAGDIIPYPPGIPLIMRGEKITANHIDILDSYLESGVTIQGDHDLDHDLIRVVQEG